MLFLKIVTRLGILTIHVDAEVLAIVAAKVLGLTSNDLLRRLLLLNSSNLAQVGCK